VPDVPLANLALPAHWSVLGQLAPPDESELTEVGRDGCLRIARRLRELWLCVINFQCKYPDSFVAPDWVMARPPRDRSDSDRLERLFELTEVQRQAHEILGSYFAYAAFSALEQIDMPSIIRIGSELTSYQPYSVPDDTDNIALNMLNLSTSVATLGVLDTICCIHLAVAVSMASLAPSANRSLDAQSQFYDLVADLTRRGDVLSRTVASSSLRYLAKVYQPSDSMSDIPLSASLRTHELLALASRADTLQQRYGARMIARLFERQLALVIESLGFLVAPAAAGVRGSDMLCISRDDAHSYSMLVDAKTSRRPYALPSRDERAFTEYVGQFRRYMGDLPRLAFVLLVGHGPARTTIVKMRLLQNHLGVPIRFVDAGDLAWLRNQLLGPVDRRLWHDALTTCDVIVTRESLEALFQTQMQTKNAYRQFAEQLRKTEVHAATLRRRQVSSQEH
jgi:hypothetical protein